MPRAMARVSRLWRDNESAIVAAVLALCTAMLTGAFWFAWDMNGTVSSLAKTQQMQVKQSTEFRKQTQQSLNSLNAAVRGIYTAKMAESDQRVLWDAIGSTQADVDINDGRIDALDKRVTALEARQ